MAGSRLTADEIFIPFMLVWSMGSFCFGKGLNSTLGLDALVKMLYNSANVM